jgi:hypothetical protein
MTAGEALEIVLDAAEREASYWAGKYGQEVRDSILAAVADVREIF